MPCLGVRSSSDGLRPPFVGALKFLIPIMNFEDAQLLRRPISEFRQTFGFPEFAAPTEQIDETIFCLPRFSASGRLKRSGEISSYKKRSG